MVAHPYDRNISNGLLAKTLVKLSSSGFRRLFRLVCLLAGCDIRAKLPATTFLPHPLGIVVSGAAQIGSNVVIGQNVTIGNKNGVVAAPIIGDFVYIGAGAVVLGGISVGHGALIGANAVVTKDIAPGRCVVGNNRIIERVPNGYWASTTNSGVS